MGGKTDFKFMKFQLSNAPNHRNSIAKMEIFHYFIANLLPSFEQRLLDLFSLTRLSKFAIHSISIHPLQKNSANYQRKTLAQHFFSRLAQTLTPQNYLLTFTASLHRKSKSIFSVPKEKKHGRY